MVRRAGTILGLAATGLAVAATMAPSAGAAVRLKRILTGLAQPVYLTSPPGDSRLFIVEKGGRIVVDRGGRVLARPFLNISNLVSKGGEQGLLSMAFDPDYPRTGRFFVSYTNTTGDSRVAQYRVEPNHPNIANPFSRRILVAFNQPFSNHNGGDIAFGPGGNLFMGFGDGGSEGDPHLNGQKRTGFLSKIMRMNVNVPHPRATMYAYGFRNPWRFSFDRKTGGLWIGDVGQDHWEEVDHLGAHTASGANFGWSYYEGTHVFKVQPINRSRLVFPVAQYPHAATPNNCAVTGGYVYRGKDAPSLDGYYVYADFCSGRIWRKHVNPIGPAVQMPNISQKVTQIASFGEGSGGGLFVISLGGGIYKVLPASG